MQSDPAHIPDLQHPRALLQYSATRPVFAIALQHRDCHIKDPHNLAERQLPLSGDLSVMPAYARDAYRKTQATAGETTKVMEQTYSAASKGAADFNLHLLDITQANMNAAFDFAR